MRHLLLSLTAALAMLVLPEAAIADTSSGAFAGVTFESPVKPVGSPASITVWAVTFEDRDGQTQKRPVAIEYSDAYRLRAKIHKYASFATLPLFVAEAFVGESLYNDPTESKKSAHLAIATGIGALFAVNGTTGVWNMIESRKDPNDRTRRTLHGILMLAASAGFLAAAATGPHSEHEHGQVGTFDPAQANTHRAIVFTSFGLALTSYMIMLLHW
jgi:hypothetical protein